MNKRFFLKAMMDGFIQGFILHVLCALFVSVYTSQFSIVQHMLTGVFGAMISSCVGFFLVRKESGKTTSIFFLVGAGSFIVCSMLLLFMKIALPFSLFPLREVNNADGILLFFLIGCYVLTSLVTRVLIIVFSIITHAHLKKKETQPVLK